jgi:hypothetical protein
MHVHIISTIDAWSYHHVLHYLSSMHGYIMWYDTWLCYMLHHMICLHVISILHLIVIFLCTTVSQYFVAEMTLIGSKTVNGVRAEVYCKWCAGSETIVQQSMIIYKNEWTCNRCMYVCMYVYIYACMNVCIYIWMFICNVFLDIRASKLVLQKVL